MHLSHLQQHLPNAVLTKETSGYNAVLICFSLRTRLLCKFLPNTGCLPYLPYFLYCRSKGWLTLLLSGTVRAHLWTLSKLFQHRRAQAQIKHCSAGIRSFSEAPANHPTSNTMSRLLHTRSLCTGCKVDVCVHFRFTSAFDILCSQTC